MQEPVSEVSGKSLFEVTLRRAETPIDRLFERLAGPIAPSSAVSDWLEDFNAEHGTKLATTATAAFRSGSGRPFTPIEGFYRLVSSRVYGDVQSVEKVKEALFARLSSSRAYTHPTAQAKNLLAMAGLPSLDGEQWRAYLDRLRAKEDKEGEKEEEHEDPEGRVPPAHSSLGLAVVAAMEEFQLGVLLFCRDSGEPELFQPCGGLSRVITFAYLRQKSARPTLVPIDDRIDNKPNVLKLDTPMSEALNQAASLIDELVLGSAKLKTRNLRREVLSKLKSSIHEHLEQAARPTLRCAFFAEPGFGKSYLLNYLLLDGDPMSSSAPNIQRSVASSGKGVTQIPVLFRLPSSDSADRRPCIKTKDRVSGKESVSCELGADTPPEELAHKLDEVLSSSGNDAELQMVVVEYEFPVLRSFSVELLDLPGYPDDKVPHLAKTIRSALVGTQVIFLGLTTRNAVHPDTVHRLHECGVFGLDPLPRIVFIGNLKDDHPDQLPVELPPTRLAEVKKAFESTIAYFRTNSALHDLRELFSTSFNLNPDITSQFVSADRPLPTSGSTSESVHSAARPRISISNALDVFVQIVTEARCLLFRTKEDIGRQYGYDSKQKLHLLLDESRTSRVHDVLEDAVGSALTGLNELAAGLKSRASRKDARIFDQVETKIGELCGRDRTKKKLNLKQVQKDAKRDLITLLKTSAGSLLRDQDDEELSQASGKEDSSLNARDLLHAYRQPIVQYLLNKVSVHKEAIEAVKKDSLKDLLAVPGSFDERQLRLELRHLGYFASLYKKLKELVNLLQAGHLHHELVHWLRWPEPISVSRPSSKLAKVLRELKQELRRLWGKGNQAPAAPAPAPAAPTEDAPTLERFLNEFDLFDDSYLPTAAKWTNHMRTLQSCEKKLRALVACDKKASVRRDKPLDSPFPKPKLYGVDGQMYSFPPRGKQSATDKKRKKKAEYGVFPTPPENLQACIDRNYARAQEEFVTRGKNVLDALLVEGKQKSLLADAVRLVDVGDTHQITISLNRALRTITVEQPAYLRGMLDWVIRDAASLDKDKRGLYPIFISSENRATSLREESSHWRPNLLVDALKLHLPSLNYVVFCAVPCRELSLYQSWFPTVHNPGLIFISLPESELGIGRIRTLFFLLAEQWRLSRFFLVDDDISEFHEYDPAIYVRGSIQHTSSTARALLFLQLTMDAEIFPSDKESVRQRYDILTSINASYNRLVYQNQELSEDDQARLVAKITVPEERQQVARDPTCLIRELEERNLSKAAQLVQQITQAKSPHVGQVALWNNLSCGKGYHDRLSGYHQSTHMVSPFRYQVVLYNLEAVAGLHPVTDDAFWEEPLSRTARHELIRKVSNAKKQPYNEAELKLMRLGYKHSDGAHIKYLLLNNISGFMVYWFSFRHRVDKATRSLVNAEDTETDGERIKKGKAKTAAASQASKSTKKSSPSKRPSEKEQQIAGKAKKQKTTTTAATKTAKSKTADKQTKAKTTKSKSKSKNETKQKKRKREEIDLTQDLGAGRKVDGRPKTQAKRTAAIRRQKVFANELVIDNQPEDTEDEQRS